MINNKNTSVATEGCGVSGRRPCGTPQPRIGSSPLGTRPFASDWPTRAPATSLAEGTR